MADLLPVSKIITRALRLIRVLAQAGRSANASEMAEGIEVLSTLTDAWSGDRLMIFNVTSHRFHLSSKQDFTIGIDPEDKHTADFQVSRPPRIENANIITQVAGGPENKIPMEIIFQQEWSQIRVLNIGSSIPRKLYCDYDTPLAGIHLWPWPNAPADLELWVWAALDEAAETDTVLALPQGYRRALEYNLAVELAPSFKNAVVSQLVLNTAIESKADIQRMNSPSPIMSCDEVLMSGHKSTFNILIGE